MLKVSILCNHASKWHRADPRAEPDIGWTNATASSESWSTQRQRTKIVRTKDILPYHHLPCHAAMPCNKSSLQKRHHMISCPLQLWGAWFGRPNRWEMQGAFCTSFAWRCQSYLVYSCLFWSFSKACPVSFIKVSKASHLTQAPMQVFSEAYAAAVESLCASPSRHVLDAF